MARTKREVDLEAELERLRMTVEELKGRVDGMQGSSSNGHELIEARSRRDMFKIAGAAVAGAAGGVLLSGIPAAAADGGSVVLGNTDPAHLATNDAAFTTTLTATGTDKPIPLVEVIGPNATLPGTNGPTFGAPLQVFGAIPSGAIAGVLSEGVDGWSAGQTGAGLLGASDQGYGVVGETSQGIDIAAFGTGRLYQLSIGDNTGFLAGPPTYTPAQPPNLPGGEIVRDVNSVLWASRATGAAAAGWKRMNTVRVDAADGSNNFFQPSRAVDSRNSNDQHPGKVGPDTSQTWGPFPGTNGIPSDAVGIVGNLTIVGYGAGNGFAAIFPAGAAYNPNTSPSTVNISGGTVAAANGFTVGFGVGVQTGKLTVYLGHVSAFVIIDIVAYIQ